MDEEKAIWKVWPDPIEDAEFIAKGKHHLRYTLYANKGESEYSIAWVTKRFGEDVYYAGEAPPTQEEIANEEKAMEDGLGLCWHNTLAFKATCEYTAYDILDEAKIVAVEEARGLQISEYSRTADRHQMMMGAFEEAHSELRGKEVVGGNH